MQLTILFLTSNEIGATSWITFFLFNVLWQLKAHLLIANYLHVDCWQRCEMFYVTDIFRIVF